MQVCGHCTICYRSVLQAVDTPHECNDVPGCKAKLNESVCAKRELCTAGNLILQAVLQLRQLLLGRVILFKRLNQLLVLQALLQHRLYAAVTFAYIAVQLAHLLYVCTAQCQAYGQYDEDCNSKHRAHDEQQHERCQQLRSCHNRGRYHFGHQRRYARDIALQSVGEVACVVFL